MAPRRDHDVDGDVVVDARWLGHTGVGRVSEALLSGLAEIQPGPWTIWGARGAAKYLWPGARHLVEETSPLAGAAQASLARVPPGLLLTPHAVRPLHPRRRSVVIVNDLIPVRFAPTPIARAAWRAFFATSVRLATVVVVYSNATRQRLASVVPSVVPRMVRLTASPVRWERPCQPTPSRERLLLYVGQLKAHKNLVRALQGFGRSNFAKSGGRFVLVGATGDVRPLHAAVHEVRVAGLVEILPWQSDLELERLYASATAVIQPSLEEGYGLPAMEALLRSVPVACSDIEAHRESLGRDRIAVFFDPLDAGDIGAAIDRAAQMAAGPDWRLRAAEWCRAHPAMSHTDFAQQFLPLVREAEGRPD